MSAISPSSSPASPASGATLKANLNGVRPKQNDLNGSSSNPPNVRANAKSHQGNGTDLDPAALNNLLAVSVIVLRQAVDMLDSNVTEDEQLTYNSKFIPGSTIGKHVRHARDHFALLLDSLDGASGAVCRDLCYDVRARGTPMEGSRAAARAALEECIARLQHVVPRACLDAPLTMNAVTPYMQTFRTSFGRELWFAALHAIHHWSMVRVIAGELNIQLEDTFGIAPSTLVYHGTEGALGKSKI